MGLFSARDWKNCATCQFWNGPRQFVPLRLACKVDQSEVGSCARRGDDRHYATNSCIGWRCWALLEKPTHPTPTAASA